MPWRVRVVIGFGVRDAVDNRSCLQEGSETALSQEIEGNILDGVMCVVQLDSWPWGRVVLKWFGGCV
jgi:hypothetical protein